MQEAIVDIICPRCAGKAQFHSLLVGSYKLYPAMDGKATCLHCGYNGPHHFSNKDYYYQLEIGKRMLYAQNLDRLISLRDFFEEGYKFKANGDPELDFPKEFYVNKEEIVKRINSILAKEL